MQKVGRIFGLVALVVGLGFFGACGGDDNGGTSPNGDSVFGTYNLVEAAGKSIPAVIEEEPGYTFEITGGSVRLNDDDTFSFRLQLRETENGQTATQEVLETGSFSRTGSQINLNSQEMGTVTASLSGGRITVIFEGVTLIFQK